MTSENPLSTAPVYDPALTRQMAGAAAGAYLGPLDANQVEVVDPVFETRAVVTREPAGMTVAFRGTQNLRNWLTDGDALMAPLATVDVHAGFLAAVNHLVPLLKAALQADGPGVAAFPLRLTGHSLGGALAALAAFRLQREGFPVASVHTFASPRVGNRAWRAAYDALLGPVTWRVVAAGDAVPLLPGLLAGYRHVGQEVFLRDGEVSLNPSRLLEIAEDSWDLYWAIRREDWLFVVKQHSMIQDYLAQLQ